MIGSDPSPLDNRLGSDGGPGGVGLAFCGGTVRRLIAVSRAVVVHDCFERTRATTNAIVVTVIFNTENIFRKSYCCLFLLFRSSRFHMRNSFQIDVSFILPSSNASKHYCMPLINVSPGAIWEGKYIDEKKMM